MKKLLSIIALGLTFAANAGIITKTLNMQSKTLQSENPIKAENGTIRTESGWLANVNVSDSLTLEIGQHLSFKYANIGNALIITHGMVELEDVNADTLIVKDGAVVFIFDSCTIKNIKKEGNARVFFVNEYK